ncbi:alpha/beta fold hydrolase [Glutamicibacter creatinolyticus]|uniref:alpha/beta fold hydrolase n=1 Tax=Glutamicibacter creatinolyticus TaxID=162496 RepID=UPI0033F69750
MKTHPAIVLVPGAWSGASVWEPTASILRRRGFEAQAVTLLGLGTGQAHASIAEVHLEDHVNQLSTHIQRMGAPVVLVSHSYSSMVTAQVADRLGEQVAGLVHFGGFMPRDGRSLLDGWGDSESARNQEHQAIIEAGNLWLPPERHMLDYERDLTATDRNRLAESFTPHPGYTVIDPARVTKDTSGQPTTYVVLSQEESQTSSHAIDHPQGRWRYKHLVSGHWPMLSQPNEVVDLIAEEVEHYSQEER